MSKKKSEWCAGGGPAGPTHYYRVADVATPDPEDKRFQRLIKKKVRCPVCNKRLQLKTHFERWHYEFNGVSIPEHKAK